MTVFTEQLMDDLGANSIYDLMAFAPNTDPFIMSTSDITGNGNDFINIPTKFVSRGGASTVVGQDFFTNNIPNDRFNSEALTFTRGPNAILFGLGNAAGAFVSSTKRAKNRTATTIEYQVDDRGSYRATLDHNHVLKKDLLAIRYSGLYENLNSFRIPTESFQRRHFVTLNLTPLKTTTLRRELRTGIDQRRTPSAPGRTTTRSHRGSPPVPRSSRPSPMSPPANRAGTQNYGQAGLISTAHSAGGTPVPTQRFTNQGQSVPTSFANGFAVNGGSFRSLVDEDHLSDLRQQLRQFGLPADRLRHTLSLFVEQQITRDLFVEAAYNQASTAT
jgi:hypothetical protein